MTIAPTDDASGLEREAQLADVQMPLQPQEPIILPEDPTLLTSIQKRKLATPLFQRLVGTYGIELRIRTNTQRVAWALLALQTLEKSHSRGFHGKGL